MLLLFIFGYFLRNGYTASTAATPMLLSIFAALIIGIYFITKKIKYLFYFLIFFMVPFLDVTRMGIASFLFILIFHFSNVQIFKKIIFGFIGVIISFLVFNSKGFQEKTFHDGNGEISQLNINIYDNNEINNNGRTTWKTALEPGILAKPFFGNGPRKDAQVLEIASNKTIKEAHNDFLSVRYNYGLVGLCLLLYGFAFNFIDVFIKLRNVKDNYSWLIGKSILTLFICFLMFMYSDNILKYTIYFPNLFFALIGIFYSLKEKGLKTKNVQSNLL